MVNLVVYLASVRPRPNCGPYHPPPAAILQPVPRSHSPLQRFPAPVVAGLPTGPARPRSRTRPGQRADSPDSPLRPVPAARRFAGRCAHSLAPLAAAWDRETQAGPDPTGPGFNPRAGTAARPGLSTPPAPGAGPLQVGKRQGVQPVTQRPSPHGTGLAACPVDPLTQRLDGPGTGRSGAGWMPGRTHFRPGPSHSAAVRGS